MRKESCKTCYYNDEGGCHRFPPKYVMKHDKYGEYQSCDYTDASGWCGEWKERGDGEAEE